MELNGPAKHQARRLNGKKLFTIGYEGRSHEDVLEQLVGHGVVVLVDIREVPFSRKNSFSKEPLRHFLSENDVEYRHYQDLGSPKQLRERVSRDGDISSFAPIFRRYLATKGKSLREVAALLKRDSVCLMCYEADYRRCHRHLVAERIEKMTGNEVVHL